MIKPGWRAEIHRLWMTFFCRYEYVVDCGLVASSASRQRRLRDGPVISRDSNSIVFNNCEGQFCAQPDLLEYPGARRHELGPHSNKGD